ncbi:MAG: hypothetical protein JXR03_04290 [Cyclobacteriaceae bacterium]
MNYLRNMLPALLCQFQLVITLRLLKGTLSNAFDRQWLMLFGKRYQRDKIVLILIMLLVSPHFTSAQIEAKAQLGTVSYVTSSRIYIKFDDTRFIIPGDTLYRIENDLLKPALVVEQKSSLSCVGRLIGTQKLKKGDQLQFNGRTLEEESPKVKKKPLVKKEDKIKGSVSVASYINASTATDFNARNMARVRLSANEINDSRFSFDTYLIYRQNIENSETGVYKSPGLFNVYGLSLQYKKDSSYSISVGRKVNRRVASLGMMDGLHAEKQLGMVHFGGIAGFRPDFKTNGFNTNLSQYGAYVGISHRGEKRRFEATVGALEQKNGGAIDRKYMYVQGSASLGYGFNIFSSAEMDLYSLNIELKKAGTRLMNLHISTNYRIGKRVRLSMSYDTRRNIIYYETFQTYLERLIADDQARQGIRARVNVKVTKTLTVGAAYGKRYQSSLQNSSNNYSGFATLRNTPLIGGTLTANVNVNQSDYLYTMATTFRHNRYYFKNKVNASTYLRSVIYGYMPERDMVIAQQFLGSSINYRFGQNITFGGLAEFSLRKAEYRNRFNLQLTKRF